MVSVATLLVSMMMLDTSLPLRKVRAAAHGGNGKACRHSDDDNAGNPADERILRISRG
jgi:hypothetical protein